MISALYVSETGIYADRDGIDAWGPTRDARLYAGPWPVIAHPPCARWGRLAGLVAARWGHEKGDDGGCFSAALAAVRKWGGVLEHPAYSDAWAAHDINRPPGAGGWVNADWLGGWTCQVEQLRYGHPARKATWLFAVGVALPSLRWGVSAVGEADALVSLCRNHTPASDQRPRLIKGAAAATPADFQAVLLEMARSVTPTSAA